MQLREREVAFGNVQEVCEDIATREKCNKCRSAGAEILGMAWWWTKPRQRLVSSGRVMLILTQPSGTLLGARIPRNARGVACVACAPALQLCGHKCPLYYMA